VERLAEVEAVVTPQNHNGLVGETAAIERLKPSRLGVVKWSLY
jgi:hypothetical protein